MNIEDIENKEDILKYMIDNIKYGWLDINNEIHIGNMKNFRKLYRTASLDEVLKYRIGTCIEQVYLMHLICNKIGLKSQMYCTRIYESNDYNNLDEEEHMHCFLLIFSKNKVYHIEHPNWDKIGIYEYDDEESAINTINKYYIELSGGANRPVTPFDDVPSNISFSEFNRYINNLTK